MHTHQKLFNLSLCGFCSSLQSTINHMQSTRSNALHVWHLFFFSVLVHFLQNKLIVFSAHPWVILSNVRDKGNPLKMSPNKASTVVGIVILGILSWKHYHPNSKISPKRSICYISRTELCKSSNDTLKYGNVEIWFITFVLTRGCAKLYQTHAFCFPKCKVRDC